jgi:hypothetical protein
LNDRVLRFEFERDSIYLVVGRLIHFPLVEERQCLQSRLVANVRLLFRGLGRRESENTIRQMTDPALFQTKPERVF